MKRNARTLLMDTTPMTVGVDSPSHALIKKKNNLQNNLTLQRKQNLVFHVCMYVNLYLNTGNHQLSLS